jgi:hypothetical protein
LILVVDSGSTKADWRLVLPDGTHVSYSGRGINPLHVLPAEILKTVRERIPAELHGQPVRRLFFYGAGCGASAATSMLSTAFSEIFSGATVEVLPDFLGAARALFGNRRGVVAVLGTGSACGLYDGSAIVSTSSSLGYILGDDGSATDLGKRLLRAFFYKRLPESLSRQLAAQGVTREKVLQSVHHSDAPAVYLASFLPVLIENRADEMIVALVEDAFDDFFTNHVHSVYSAGYPLGVAGSVGFIFSDILRETAKKHEVESVDFLQYPIAKLAEFHILQP